MNPTLKIRVTNATGETLLTTIKTRYESFDKTILSLAAKIVNPQVISLSITKIDADFDFNLVSRDSSSAAARNLVYGDEFTMETETTLPERPEKALLTRNSKDTSKFSVRSLHSQIFLHRDMFRKHPLDSKSCGLEVLHLEIHLRAQSHPELAFVLECIDRNVLPEVQ
jgi:hypothetical protein